MRMNCHPIHTTAVVMLCLLGAQGCGNGRFAFETVPVQGTVTLNSQPLRGARVTFHPENGRPAYGVTDAAGHYQLVYLEGKPGALPGTHKVTISTKIEADSDANDPEKRAGRPESLSSKYNSKTQLQAVVSQSVQSPINFDLKQSERTNSSRRNKLTSTK